MHRLTGYFMMTLGAYSLLITIGIKLFAVNNHTEWLMMPMFIAGAIIGCIGWVLYQNE